MNTVNPVPSSQGANVVRAIGEHARMEDVETVIHEHEIPAFAAAEIDRLHGHLYCTLSYLEMTGQASGASTYVARRAGKPIAVLLFKHENDVVIVISEFMRLDDGEIRRFADVVFTRYGNVNVVSFNRVRADCRRISYPWHAVACTEDMVVALPKTVKEYETQVGKNMRRNIKRYTSALQRDFPSYSFTVREGPDVGEQPIRDLIRLGCMRMQSKNIVPRYTEEETQWIVQLARHCGLVGIATVDGQVCGGAIGFRIGENYFMHVISHDPRYNDYSLGILCYFHTMCQGIARGGKAFHLLQGRYGYKYRLLAERKDVLHIDIYRSRLQALMHGRKIARKAVEGRVLAFKQWLLHDAERSGSPAMRLLGRAVDVLRRRRRTAGSVKNGDAR